MSDYQRNDKIITRKFYQYLIPTVLMILAMQFGSLADAIVIGNFLGDNALSAASLALPAVFLVEIPGMMIGAGASIVGANFIGKRMIKEASQTFKLAIFLSFALSLIFIPIGLLAGDAVAAFFAGSFNELIPMISQYIKVYACQAPILGIGITLAYFLPSDNNPNLGAAFFVICNVVHIAAEVLFCIFLDASVAMWGVAASMGIGMIAGCAVFIPYFKSKKRVIDLRVPLRGSFGHVRALLKSGSATGALTALSFVYYLVLNIAATNYLGAKEMPLYAMLMNFSFVIDIFVLGILQIMPSVISSLFGEKDYYGIRSICRRALLLSMGVTVLLTAISMIWPNLFFMMFGVDLAGVMEGATVDPLLVVRIYCCSFVLYTFNKYLVYYYPSIFHNAPAVLSNTVRTGLIGPLAIFFLMQGMGVMGTSIGVIVMEGGTILAVIAFVLIAKKLGKYEGSWLLLLPSVKKEEQIELSVPAKKEEIGKVIEVLQENALKIGGDMKAATMLAVASEEIISNTILYGYKRKSESNYIDISLSKADGALLVRIRDDGIAFDPTSQLEEEEDDMSFHGIDVVRKVATEFKYLRLLNTNNTIMEIALGK